MAAQPRNNENHQEDAILFEAVVELGKLLGLNKAAALALALLFAAEQPLSLDDISERSGIAKSSSSVILKSLNQMGLVEVVHQPHNRRKFYRATENPAERIAMLFARRLESLQAHQHQMVQLSQTSHSQHYACRIEQLNGVYQGLLQAANFLRQQRAGAWKGFDERLAPDETADAPFDSAMIRQQP